MRRDVRRDVRRRHFAHFTSGHAGPTDLCGMKYHTTCSRLPFRKRGGLKAVSCSVLHWESICGVCACLLVVCL